MSSEHVVPVKVYMAVWASLLVLTALTTGVAYVDLGKIGNVDMNTVAALVIAAAKMMLVVLFFMHAKYTPGLPRIVVVAALFWLGIMMSLTLADELTRSWSPMAHSWVPGVLFPLLPHLLH
jgi:cytochrome c oxidase subunit IV